MNGKVNPCFRNAVVDPERCRELQGSNVVPSLWIGAEADTRRRDIRLRMLPHVLLSRHNVSDRSYSIAFLRVSCFMKYEHRQSTVSISSWASAPNSMMSPCPRYRPGTSSPQIRTSRTRRYTPTRPLPPPQPISHPSARSRATTRWSQSLRPWHVSRCREE